MTADIKLDGNAPVADIFDRYPAFRDRPREAAMLVALLKSRGATADAFAMGEAAVAAAPDSCAVRDAVNGALSAGVPGFHVAMMLDEPRNRAYARAIERTVRPGMMVLEIGTGAGLLAMMAARAGATVVTCEFHPMVATAATQIIKRNGLDHRVTVIAKRSTDLVVGEDLPEPADLVIHEIFGSALVDEGVTGALSDARRRLLKPDAPSVPPRAWVCCALARGPRAISGKSRLASVEGFDLSLFKLLARPKPYVDRDERLMFEPVSEAQSLLRMDYAAPPPFGPTTDRAVMASFGGRIDFLVQWLALDFGEGEILDNDPFVDRPHASWGARVIPLVAPIDTVAGELIEVVLTHRQDQLFADIRRLNPA